MRWLGFFLGAVFALDFVARAALAGTIQDSASDALHQALAESSPSVGMLSFAREAGGQYSASGTLIADHWVLTAGQVGAGAQDMTFTLSGVDYQVEQIEVRDSWDGDPTSGNDLALLRLAQPVVGVNPAVLYSGNSELGETATFVGYGKGGAGTGGANSAAGTLRAGENVIDAVGLDLSAPGGVFSDRIFFSDFDSGLEVDNQMGTAVPLPYEYMIASGDTGGGVFIDVAGQPRLAGVASFILALDGSANSDYGDISGAIRISSHHDWIEFVLTAEEPAPVPALGPRGIGLLLAILVLTTCWVHRNSQHCAAVFTSRTSPERLLAR